jgi:hypothetical protein
MTGGDIDPSQLTIDEMLVVSKPLHRGSARVLMSCSGSGACGKVLRLHCPQLSANAGLSQLAI